MKKKKNPLKNFAFRADAAKMKRAKELELDLGVIFRQALDEAIAKYRGMCPVCGSDCRLTNLK